MRLSRFALIFALAVPLLATAQGGSPEPMSHTAPSLVGHAPASPVVLPATDFIQKAVPSAQLQKEVPVPGESTPADGFLAYSFHRFESGDWALGVVGLLAGLGAALRLYGSRLHPWFSTSTGVAVVSAASSVTLMVLHSLAADAAAAVTWLTVVKAVSFALVAAVPTLLLLKQPPTPAQGRAPGSST